jgi:hypothetical protein
MKAAASSALEEQDPTLIGICEEKVFSDDVVSLGEEAPSFGPRSPRV